MTVVPSIAVAEAAHRVDVDAIFGVADVRLRVRVAEVGSYPELRWPIARNADSSLWTARAPLEWDSGYFPGTLWQMYRRNGNADYFGWAKRWTNGLIGIGPNDPISNDLSWLTLGPAGHDVGIVYLDAFGEGFAATGDAGYARVLHRAATQLSTRYVPATGTIRSWDWGPWASPTIIDGMMSVQTLNWSAAHGGNASLSSMAASHAHQSAAYLERADGSTFHVVDFGQHPPVGSTYQGYSNTSTWARGEAWAIHGFTSSAIANPSDPTLIAAARGAADYFLAHTTDDAVPLWDLNLPTGASASLYKRDTSAAAIAASGLILLSAQTTRADEQRRYFQAAERILNRLMTPTYLAAAAPGETRLLLHGVGSFNSNSAPDADLTYSDYYLLDAASNYDRLFPGPGIGAGDANRDGIVGFDDLLILARHYNTVAGANWLDGDFTRDGTVAFEDLLVLAKHYQGSSAARFSAEWALAQAVVPEPASMVLLAGLAWVRRRR